MPKQNRISTSDIQGLTRIITDATTGITDLVEDMQSRIVHPTYFPSSSIQNLISGISEVTYKSIKFGIRIVGGGLDKILGQLHLLLGEMSSSSPEKETAYAILNGVVGDYLENSKNPLFIPMQFRFEGKRIVLNSENIAETYSNVNGKILLMIHGLCMNDTKWSRNNHNHGEELAKELNLTPVYLYYCTGRHISSNGQNLNILLEKLMNEWPVSIEEIFIVSHSMGGLVTRSAIYYGNKSKNSWIHYLNKIVFLGTPHHGTSLEKTGNYVDHLLDSVPYLKPFTRLNKIRSSGITDLRYGNLIDEDWVGVDRFKNAPDQRIPIPLPIEMDCHTIAATKSKNKDNNLSNRIFGDGLVPLKSALGQHRDSIKKLSFKKLNTHIMYECTHMDLLSDLNVYDKIKKWLIE